MRDILIKSRVISISTCAMHHRVGEAHMRDILIKSRTAAKIVLTIMSTALFSLVRLMETTDGNGRRRVTY